MVMMTVHDDDDESWWWWLLSSDEKVILVKEVMFCDILPVAMFKIGSNRVKIIIIIIIIIPNSSTPDRHIHQTYQPFPSQWNTPTDCWYHHIQQQSFASSQRRAQNTQLIWNFDMNEYPNIGCFRETVNCNFLLRTRVIFRFPRLGGLVISIAKRCS